MTASEPTLYEILGLQTRDATGAEVKTAYRRSLLLHHPDKIAKSGKNGIQAPGSGGETSRSSTSASEQFSIDQITEAYAVLSSPARRAVYDRDLMLGSVSAAQSRLGGQAKDFRTGEEIVDLDDLDFDEDKSLWFRSCRCGDSRGFIVEEDELEEAVDDGEIGVGCRGCSLWIKVQFSAAEDDEDDGKG